MPKPIFYQAELKEIKGSIFLHVYHEKGMSMNMAERMDDENATCPECGKNKWWLLPKEGAVVREGGKPYIECLFCGYQTHL